MKKEFNITGTCRSAEHYMMDDTRRFAEIIDFVERGKYFVINRPRQYGKTTMLFALLRFLDKQEDYFPLKLDLQGTDSQWMESDAKFSEMFLMLVRKDLKRRYTDKVHLTDNKSPKTLDELSEWISDFITAIGKKVVLLIDEVDSSSNYEPFLRFLGMLRNKYLAKEAGEITFHSVVLAGVHDIKSLKFKLRNPQDAQYNSPWNIATDFEVVMEFYPVEIITMLKQYSEAENVQMDFEAMAEKLYYYTSGYPFLVSKLCKTIAEKILPKKQDKSKWTLEDLETSVQLLLKEANTNFDSLIKNLENNTDLYDLVYRIIINGERVPFSVDAPMIRLGLMYGIFKENGTVKIHNRIYEQRLYTYMAVRAIEENKFAETRYLGDQFTLDDGSLDLETVLRKFQAFMKEQYSKRNKDLIEREWRLIFLSFLKPILNGQGHDFKEVETSEEKRLDIVVTYLQWKYIIELKRWSGEKSHQRGLTQLANYLDIHSVDKGWLLIFDDRKNPTWREELITHEGKEIFAVWV
jgi:hypothetical protein